MASRHNRLHADQRGLVSFMIVTVLMLITTLIVLSFARLVSREQIQTLDRQLNVQAQYAAESGINDAVHALLNNPSAIPQDEYTDCTGNDSFIDAAGLTSASELDSNISYSCLLVDRSVPDLDLPGVNTAQSIVTKIKPASGTINRLRFSWRSNVPAPDFLNCPTAGVFPVSWPATCQIGMLRFELVTNTVHTNRSSLIENRAIGFLQPITSGGSGSRDISELSGDNQGNVTGVQCTASGCEFEITGLSIDSASEAYLRVRSIYRNTPLKIEAFDNNETDPLELVDAQVEIDATGRAGGVIKRIKVRKQLQSTGSSNPAPEFALQSRNTICKQFTFRPDAVTVPSGTDSACNPLAP